MFGTSGHRTLFTSSCQVEIPSGGQDPPFSLRLLSPRSCFPPPSEYFVTAVSSLESRFSPLFPLISVAPNISCFRCYQLFAGVAFQKQIPFQVNFSRTFLLRPVVRRGVPPPCTASFLFAISSQFFILPFSAGRPRDNFDQSWFPSQASSWRVKKSLISLLAAVGLFFYLTILPAHLGFMVSILFLDENPLHTRFCSP